MRFCSKCSMGLLYYIKCSKSFKSQGPAQNMMHTHTGRQITKTLDAQTEEWCHKSTGLFTMPKYIGKLKRNLKLNIKTFQK